MDRLIEDYLRTRGGRYFRGHRDCEYFFRVDFVAGAHRGRVEVRLQGCGPDRGSVQLSIAPDRFYPAARRDLLTAAADRWNAAAPVLRAAVHDSSDPHLVGVLATAAQRPAGPAELADFVESAVSGAADLFGLMSSVSGLNGPVTRRADAPITRACAI